MGSNDQAREVATTERLLAQHPRTAVVMLTMLEDDDSLFAALRAGAHGTCTRGGRQG